MAVWRGRLAAAERPQAAAEFVAETFTYKTVGNCPIRVGVFRPNDDRVRPGVVWMHGVAHELITVPGAGHGLSGGDRQLVADAHARALAFVKRHLAPR